MFFSFPEANVFVTARGGTNKEKSVSGWAAIFRTLAPQRLRS